MQYNLELDCAVEKIKKENAKTVCVQLPDGLKPKAQEITQYLQKKTDAVVVIWLGSCYGACDVPTQVQNLGVDLLIQWGHSEWK